MKFITVRDLRTSPAKVWQQLPEEQELVITNNGKPIALLTPLSDATLEETLAAVRQARAQNAVRQIQRHSVQDGKSDMSMDEIQAEINQSRSDRRR